jgi:hypothetical protein
LSTRSTNTTAEHLLEFLHGRDHTAMVLLYSAPQDEHDLPA